MKIKIALLLYALMLWVVSPVLAQNNGNGNGGGNGSGKGHGHGSGHSDKGGPNDNGSDKGGPDDNGSDKGDHDDKGDHGDKGEGHGNSSLLTATTAQVVTALASGTLTTSSGASIPVSAQVKVYAVLTRSGATTGSASQLDTPDGKPAAAVKERLEANFARLSAPLAAAGPSAEATLPPLMRSLSGLAYNPDWLPTAIADYNTFVQSASASFLADPPPEFVALHAVLARMTAAAGGGLTTAAGGKLAAAAGAK
jgi:hypothetical protein